ncbi:SDR family NAD(P)-dependent oxidoreductase [Amycolatopsis sp. GA6-003]|uniref:SDR family NAD(P)-dependent oxidoreductase n=1 Tax=Amycolatopsis sp. GA6-003 TaxID=2652444 RepID=UPI00391720CD
MNRAHENAGGTAGTRFAGKTAVVAGAAGDLGRRLCHALLDEKATVVGIDVDGAAGERLRTETRSAGKPFSFERVDIADPGAVTAFARTLDRVDVLINAAGIIQQASIADTSVEEWDRVLGVNLRGAFLLTKALAPLLGDGAAVVNVSSSVALRGGAGWSAYSVSKAGLVAFTKVAAAELAPRCRVNVVCPGPLDTQMPHQLLRDHPDKEAVMSQLARSSMLGRLGEAQEVVPLCLFLASDEASLVTGATVVADGGITAW